jgi:hypothetical protein
MNLKNLLPAAVSLLLLSCNDNTKGVITETTFKWPEGVAAPKGEKTPYEMVAHGDKRVDNYYWMNAFFKKSILDSNKVDDNLNAQERKSCGLPESRKCLCGYNDVRRKRLSEAFI